MADGRQSIVGALALLGATVAVIFSVALTSDARDAPFQAGDRAASRFGAQQLLELAVERMPLVAQRVAAIRGLDFKRVPEPRVSDAADLRRRVERRLARPSVRRSLVLAEAELRLLGLLAPDQRLGEVASDATSLAAAYYDPGPGELFLVADAVPAGAQLTEFILAHELTHALEDQRFGLPRSRGLSDDRVLAESALVEGTATALMSAYAGRHLNPLALAAQSAGIDAGAGELPRFAMAEVEFTYLAGADFVAALRSLGSGWSLVDYAYGRRLPATTEQVLHPQKYLDDERAIEVPPPPRPRSGWRAVDSGSLGEFGTREVLRAGERGLGADIAAAGWGGDRYRLFVRDGRPVTCAGGCRATHALAVAWHADRPVEGRELARALSPYAEEALGGEAQRSRSWRLDDGWAAVARRGERVGLGLAPTRALAMRLALPAG